MWLQFRNQFNAGGCEPEYNTSGPREFLTQRWTGKEKCRWKKYVIDNIIFKVNTVKDIKDNAKLFNNLLLDHGSPKTCLSRWVRPRGLNLGARQLLIASILSIIVLDTVDFGFLQPDPFIERIVVLVQMVTWRYCWQKRLKDEGGRRPFKAIRLAEGFNHLLELTKNEKQSTISCKNLDELSFFWYFNKKYDRQTIKVKNMWRKQDSPNCCR